ncbi:MAG: DUF5615 family PIN-like protein [Actinomycetota bacterium]
MKLLLDANISRFLVELLEDLFPGSTHVAFVDLESVSDREVWEYAAANEFMIVSKDEDFHQLAFLYGPPPKVVWLRLGNCTTAEIETALRDSVELIREFALNEYSSFLIIERPHI